MTHFVYVYAKQPAIWEELSYSILSIKKFFKGDFEIWVYGDDPRIRGVHWVKTERVVSIRGSKTLDINSKLLKISQNSLLPENFVYLYDDIIILRSCTEEDFKPSRAIDHVPKPGVYFGPGAKPSHEWISQFVKTLTILKEEKLPTWNYETHLARWYNREKVQQMVTKYNLLEEPLLFASLYFNNFCKEPDETIFTNPDLKVGIYDPHEIKWLERNVPGKLMLNMDNVGLNEALKKYIKNMFK